MHFERIKRGSTLEFSSSAHPLAFSYVHSTIETVYTFYIYDTADLLEILRKLEIRKLVVRASIGKENRVLSFTMRNISGPSTSTIIISIRGGIREITSLRNPPLPLFL